MGRRGAVCIYRHASERNSVMNEEALLARASEERERIFLRYERGRDNLIGQIDPWEDPEFEEYHKTDR